MKKIAIYGAFDRFNYGDMLFPLILERVFESYVAAYRLDYYGIINSDLSSFGGKPTKSVELLFDGNNLEDGSIVVVAGGEVLGARWFDIYSYLVPESLGSFIEATRKHISRDMLNTISPLLPGVVLDLPFVISPEDFKNSVRVIYNSVGGTSLANVDFPSRLIPAVQAKLSKAAFSSVRDQASLALLNNHSFPDLVRLAPDSASLVSKYFPKASLIERIASETVHCFNEFGDNYFVLQVGCNYIKSEDAIKQLANEIELVYNRFRLPVVLCPIGTALRHEDHIPLRAVQKLLRTPSKLIKTPTVFDIMALIANSRLFIGTSLHGAITAMSFAVPNLALTNQVSKVDAYLNTWALPSLRGSVPINALNQDVARAISLPQTDLERKRQELVDASLASFDLMLKTLDSGVVDDIDCPATRCSVSSARKAPPLSSIILLTHNNLQQVQYCLHHLQVNTQPDDYELIIVDNASTDGTIKLLEAFFDTSDNVQRVEFVQKQKFSRLLNDGAKLASGDNLVFLDSATIVPYGWLGSLTRLLADDGTGIVGPVSNAIGSQGWQNFVCNIKGQDPDFQLLDEFAKQLAITCQGKWRKVGLSSSFCFAIRRSLFNDIGQVDEQFGSRLISIQDLAMRLLSKGYYNACAEDVFLHVWGRNEFDSTSREENLIWCHEDIAAFENKWHTEGKTSTLSLEQMAIVNSFLEDAVNALFDLVVIERSTVMALRDELTRYKRISLRSEEMAENAFRAYKEHNLRETRYWVLRCFVSDPRWLRNRGLISIMLESWLGHRLMMCLRRNGNL